ncbi:LPS export ABC transporter periplasmic protein LptC [Avrilella dinanensis]|nr:LPS export ABC transporter periplasmic protein LptC [Avrilella dinanensis]
MKKFAGYMTAIMSLAILISCGNEQNYSARQTTELIPAGIAEKIEVKYTDSARIKAILFADKMLDYSNVKYPFNDFPEGVNVVVFDEDKNKNFIEADYAIAYSKTGLIDLRGNVKITSHNGTVMTTPQLYYDQKLNWFFTEYRFKVVDENQSVFEGIGVDFDSEFKTMNAHQNRGVIKGTDSADL